MADKLFVVAIAAFLIACAVKAIHDYGFKSAFWLITVLFAITAASRSFKSEVASSICFAFLFISAHVAVDQISKREKKLNEKITRLEATNKYLEEKIRIMEEEYAEKN